MRRTDLAMLLLATTIFTPAFAVPARAADPAPSLPDVVVTATRIPTLVVDIPAGVTVIDRQTIEAQGYVTLSDALATVPGLRVSQSGGPGGNASVFMRGTDSNHVLVLRDGMPLNDASDSSGAFNFGIDTLSDIERIEVIRGPMAALYGSGAIGGVINLITRRGTGAACASGTVRRLSGAGRRQCGAFRHPGSGRLRRDRGIAVPAGLRHHAAADVDLHQHAAGLPRPGRHAEPGLYAHRGHAAVAVAARTQRDLRLQLARLADLR
jgi:outer membrane cobalamin receptor